MLALISLLALPCAGLLAGALADGSIVRLARTLLERDALTIEWPSAGDVPATRASAVR
jgi:hypothetical protein